MDIHAVIRRVINDHDPDLTSGAAHLGTLIADALSGAGLAELDGDQVADYIRELGDRWGERGTDALVDALTEAIEEDLDGEDED
jgi:hypothetical protein